MKDGFGIALFFIVMLLLSVAFMIYAYTKNPACLWAEDVGLCLALTEESTQ